MPQQRDTVTDRLMNVIQVIQLGRKSGLLTVERGEGTQLEDGTIIFVNGQATQAQIARHTGLDAFRRLSTWGDCRFSFIAAPQSSRATSPLPPLAQDGSIGSLMDTGARVRAQRAAGNRQLQVPSPPAADTGARMHAQRSNFNGQTTTKDTHSAMQSQQGRPASPPGFAPGALLRTRQLEDGLRVLAQAGLSRTHRRLYLLIDGLRSPAELARLMGREGHAVQALLQELADAGLIQL
jgi:Domain of unknown function (DUF4388)